MLDSYKIGQPIAYNIMCNALVNSKLSHAYLFDAMGCSDSLGIVMSFVKAIICKANYTENSKCAGCTICRRIEVGNYLDVKIIEPNGLWIKKDQLLELQSEFSKEAIEGSKKVYIIKEAEKMNVQTANSILKFLEEPNDNIIAILITNDLNKILPTIVSRCQIIKLKKTADGDLALDNFNLLLENTKYASLEIKEKEKILNDICYFVEFFENNRLDTIIYMKRVWHNVFKDRDINIIAFDTLIYFYYDVLKYMNSKSLSFFKDRSLLIEKVANMNDMNSILRKLNLFVEAKDDVRKNLNLNLMLDKLIIDMCGD